MGKDKSHEGTAPTRREILKKAGVASVFIIPTVTTFKIADLAQAASPADWEPPDGPNV